MTITLGWSHFFCFCAGALGTLIFQLAYFGWAWVHGKH